MGIVQRSIFISKPNALSTAQAKFWERLRNMLAERGLRYRTLGETDYPNCAPVEAVRRVLLECEGCIVLGLRQVHVVEGVAKEGTSKESKLSDAHLPTPWNQIEAGMAFMLRLPMLIVREEGVSGGVFDVGNTDRFIHQAELSEEWLKSERFLQPFNEWHEEVLKFERGGP